MSTYGLDKLFSPRSVAVVGASPHKGSVGRAVVHNLRAGGFSGSLSLVNPYHREIDGLTAAASIESIDPVPDVAVITSPPESVPQIIAAAAGRGVAAAMILTAGLGHGTGSLAEAAERAAREKGLRIVGPNCLGAMVPAAKFNATFAIRMPRPGDLALVSQSGAIVAGTAEWAAQRAIGFSAVVSIGDQLDVDLGDLLDFFAMDRSTRAILLYVESIRNARKFMSAARAAARASPWSWSNPAATRRAPRRRQRIPGRSPAPTKSTMRRSAVPACCGLPISTSCSVRWRRSGGSARFPGSALRS
jgi:acetyltransferase